MSKKPKKKEDEPKPVVTKKMPEEIQPDPR